MRKFLVLALFIFIALTVMNYRSLKDLAYISPCDITISYKIGTIDPRFNLKKEELLASVEEAANVWRNIHGKQLFVYNPEGSLTIKMDYDARQLLSSEIDSIKNNLDEEKNNISPTEKEYQTLAQDFKIRLANLNSQIEYWNSHGGAPEEEYNRLIEEQKNLQQTADKLNQMARSLNRATNQYNTQVDQLNQTVKDFNSAIKIRPEEGLYSGSDNSITIYFNRGEIPLTHTLSHELGHALGMNHVRSEDAILFSQTNDVIIPTQQDTDELNRVCKEEFAPTVIIRKILKDIRRITQSNA